MLTLPAPGVLVDRVAIAAGNKVITDSEIDLRIRLTAFQNAEKSVFTLEARKKAAQLLIDQKLVEREMDVGHYPRLSEDARKQLFADYVKDDFKSDTAAIRRALLDYGLTEDDLEADLARQSDVLTFLNLRFRLAVSDQNAQLANQRADADMNAWIGDQRKRTKIEYLEKELAP
ncbi:MAG: hypothetical protein ABSB15_17650 [Bryobacteraceae bacterium]